MSRISLDEYFLKLAMLVSERATCPRLHCGCVLVKDKNVVSTGYNGSLPNEEHCDSKGVGCKIENNSCIRTIHSEINALLQAAKLGHSVKGATAYVTTVPCRNCAKALITSGIKRVVVFSDYHKGSETVQLFLDNKVGFNKLEVPENKINYNLKGYSSAKEFKNE